LDLNGVILTDRLLARLSPPLLEHETERVLRIPTDTDLQPSQCWRILRIEDAHGVRRERCELGAWDANTYYEERAGNKIYFDPPSPLNPVVTIVRWPEETRIPSGARLDASADDLRLARGFAVESAQPLLERDEDWLPTLPRMRHLLNSQSRFEINRWADLSSIRIGEPFLQRTKEGFVPVRTVTVGLRQGHPLSDADLVSAARLLDESIPPSANFGWLRYRLEG
jgi:hypothetical protein